VSELDALQDPGRRPRARFDPLPEWAGVSTRLVHGARRAEYNAGAVVPPIYQSTTFHYPSGFSEAADRGGLYEYSRLANPTAEVRPSCSASSKGANRPGSSAPEWERSRASSSPW